MEATAQKQEKPVSDKKAANLNISGQEAASLTHPILQLQKAIGNRAIQKLVQEPSVSQQPGMIILKGITSSGQPAELEAEAAARVIRQGDLASPIGQRLPPDVVAGAWSEQTPCSVGAGQMMVSTDFEARPPMLRVEFQGETRRSLPPYLDTAAIVEQGLSLSEGSLEVVSERGNIVTFRITENFTEEDRAQLGVIGQMSAEGAAVEETLQTPRATAGPGRPSGPGAATGERRLTPAEMTAPIGEANIPESMRPDVQRFRDTLRDARARSEILSAAYHAALEIHIQEVNQTDVCSRFNLTEQQASVYVNVMQIVNDWQGMGSTNRVRRGDDPCRGLTNPENRVASELRALGGFALPDESEAFEGAMRTQGLEGAYDRLLGGEALSAYGRSAGNVVTVIDLLSALHDADVAAACASEEGQQSVREVTACFHYAQETGQDPMAIYHIFRAACERMNDEYQCRVEQRERGGGQ